MLHLVKKRIIESASLFLILIAATVCFIGYSLYSRSNNLKNIDSYCSNYFEENKENGYFYESQLRKLEKDITDKYNVLVEVSAKTNNDDINEKNYLSVKVSMENSFGGIVENKDFYYSD